MRHLLLHLLDTHYEALFVGMRSRAVWYMARHPASTKTWKMTKNFGYNKGCVWGDTVSIDGTIKSSMKYPVQPSERLCGMIRGGVLNHIRRGFETFSAFNRRA